MQNENMMIRMDCGVIDIALRASSEENLRVLREELFNWYEDIVGRELEQGRHVETTSTPYISIKTRNEAFDRVEECVKKLKNLAFDENTVIKHYNEEIITEAAKLLRWLQETYLLPF